MTAAEPEMRAAVRAFGLRQPSFECSEVVRVNEKQAEHVRA
jgi:hypothetical protein